MKDSRTGDIKRQPSRLGRLLLALRTSVHSRATDPNANEKFKLKAHLLPTPMTRNLASVFIQDVTGEEIDAADIRRFETGQNRRPKKEKLKVLLISYGLSDSEITSALADHNLNSEFGANPHLIQEWRLRNLAIGEFGAIIRDALPLGDYQTSWVESEKAAEGGFKEGEVLIRAIDEEVKPPKVFVKRADDAAKQNELKKQNGIRGWSDNQTFCLDSVVTSISNDCEERNLLNLTMKRSWYRYNVIAKQEAAADFRWEALQNMSHPIKPEAYLASGVGICINVICDGGKSIVLGQRSDHETFRKGEYDVAVVEGIRPNGDIEQGIVDIVKVAYRALSEELGLDEKTLGKPLNSVIQEIKVFEFGCDLEFYQWNFIGFAKVNLDFDTIYRCWQKAKDRKENQTIRAHKFDKKALQDTFSKTPIWSSGIACALRSFDYI